MPVPFKYMEWSYNNSFMFFSANPNICVTLSWVWFIHFFFLQCGSYSLISFTYWKPLVRCQALWILSWWVLNILHFYYSPWALFWDGVMLLGNSLIILHLALKVYYIGSNQHFFWGQCLSSSEVRPVWEFYLMHCKLCSPVSLVGTNIVPSTVWASYTSPLEIFLWFFSQA